MHHCGYLGQLFTVGRTWPFGKQASCTLIAILNPFDRSRTFQVQILEDLKARLFLNTPHIELSPLWEAGQVVVFEAFKGSLALQKKWMLWTYGFRSFFKQPCGLIFRANLHLVKLLKGAVEGPITRAPPEPQAAAPSNFQHSLSMCLT